MLSVHIIVHFFNINTPLYTSLLYGVVENLKQYFNFASQSTTTMNTSKAILKENLRTTGVSINFQRLDDTQLVSYFSKPDHIENVYRELIRRFQQKVYFYVRNMVIQHEMSHFITVNTFQKIWDEMHSVRSHQNLKVWIYRLASNETISYLKKHWPNLDFDEAQPEFADFLNSGEFLTSDTVALKWQKSLCYLPYKQKLVFVLKKMEGFSNEEISELTQTSESAIEASYQYAVKKVEIYLNALGI